MDIITRKNFKNEPVPYYLQLANVLREEIKKGKYKIGNRLPTEAQLAQKWEISRITVRSALTELEKENLIYRIPSRGTFVNDLKKENPLLKLRREKMESTKFANRTIGILVPCVTISLYPGIVRGAEDSVREKGYHISLGNYDVSPEKETDYLSFFVKSRVKGVISAPSYNSEPQAYLDFLKAGIPLVLVDVRVPKVFADLVSTDNIEGGRLATEILIQKKGKKIGFICGGLHSSSSQERLLGYRRALQDNGIRYRTSLVKSGPFTSDFGCQAASSLISSGVDSIFAANENITLGVMEAVKESKKEIKVVSFDEPKIPPHLPHPIAFVTQPRQEIGRVAGQLLLERVKKGGANEPAKKICLAPKLIKFF